MATANKRRYVFHFDLENTILMKDTTTGLSVHDNVCRIVCKSAWGKLSQKEVTTGNETKTETVWSLVHDQLTSIKPESPSMLANIPDGENADENNIVTYQAYLDLAHPRQQNEDGSYDPAIEEARQKLQSQFARPGGAGAKFKNQFDKMIKQLTLPKGAREELGIGEDGSMPADEETAEEDKNEDDEEDVDPAKVAEQAKLKAERKMNATLFNEGKYHLIPSFWRLLMYMKKQKREFAVVFDSFGDQMDNAVYEFNKFCAGEHPCYNGRSGGSLVKFDGSKNAKDLRIRDPSQRVTLYRQGEAINTTIQVNGKHERNPDQTDQAHINTIDDNDEIYVTRDHVQQFQANLETLKKYGSMAVSQDEPHWQANGCKNNRSKLLLIDQADYNTQHIYFDDRADVGDEGVIDVRDIITGEKINQRKYMDMYVVKVQPHKAILEPEYFIKKYEDADEKRDLEIQRVESGIESEAEEVQQSSQLDSIVAGDTDWEKIQKMNDADYLMRTVLPILYQGMRVIDLERPSAPLEYLSLYLLKHQDMIKLPPKAFSKQEDGEENSGAQ